MYHRIGPRAELRTIVHSPAVRCVQWVRQGAGSSESSVSVILALGPGGQYYKLHEQHEFASPEKAESATTSDARISVVGYMQQASAPEDGLKYTSTLRIEDAQAGDQGEYLCVAESHRLQASHLVSRAIRLRVIVGAPRLASGPARPGPPPAQSPASTLLCLCVLDHSIRCQSHALEPSCSVCMCMWHCGRDLT